jgi:peroxiredoxin
MEYKRLSIESNDNEHAPEASYKEFYRTANAATLAQKAVLGLFPLSTTNLCEKEISSYTSLKTKYRNRLNPKY